MWMETDSPIHHSNYSLIKHFWRLARAKIGNYCHLGVTGRKELVCVPPLDSLPPSLIQR